MYNNLLTYIPAFVKALKEQLTKDEKKWGDTWMVRPGEGQEDRFFSRINDYYKVWKWSNGKKKIPWLKVAGEALIGWVRETQQEEET